MEKARGKDVIDDGVNNGSGSQPIDIINDHLPELQRLRSIIRNADVVGRHFSRSLRLPCTPDRSCCRFFFRPPHPPSPLQRHRLRVIPAWAGISFFPPAILEIRQDSFITGIRGREQNAAKTSSQDEKRTREKVS